MWVTQLEDVLNPIKALAERKKKNAIRLLASIYKRRFDRPDRVIRKHPLIRGPTDNEIETAGKGIGKALKEIITAYAGQFYRDSRFVRSNSKIPLEMDKKEEAREKLEEEINKWLIKEHKEGVDAARISEEYARIRVDWEGFMDDAIAFLNSYTITLSDYLDKKSEWELRTTIQDGLVQGKGALEIGRDIEKLGGEYKDRGLVIARTEGMKAMNQSRITAYKEMGYAKMIWIATDPQCEVCQEYDNKVYPMDEFPMIPAHPNCRCVCGPYTGYENIVIDPDGNEVVKW